MKTDNLNVRFCVVHKDKPTLIIRSFKERAEANYFITDCFGPESAEYKIIEIDMRSI